jgi:hypothetical protein
MFPDVSGQGCGLEQVPQDRFAIPSDWRVERHRSTGNRPQLLHTFRSRVHALGHLRIFRSAAEFHLQFRENRKCLVDRRGYPAVGSLSVSKACLVEQSSNRSSTLRRCKLVTEDSPCCE